MGVDLLAGNDCTAGYQLVVRGRKRLREEVQVRLYPSVGLQRGEGRLLSQTLPEVSFNRFCAGLARVTIGRVDPDGNLKLLASRRVRIAKDAAYPEPLGTPARIEVLAGSSLLVQAPGRPDRTLAVGGLLRGYIPGMFKPNTDVSIKLETGSLTLDTISPDPLCSGGSYKLNFGIDASGPSNLVLQASGSGVLTLELLADPLSLAGCSAPATPGKTT